VWFVHYLHPKFSPSWWGVALEVLVVLALLLVALALTAIAWVLLQGALCGYFYERLARRVEIELGLPAEAMREVSLGYQIADALRDMLRLVLVNGGLLLLNFVPVVGSAAALVGGGYVTCFTLGEDFFDHPLGLRGYRRAEKLAFCRRHRAHTLGLGAAVFLVSLVPVLGSVLLTTAAVGAVLLHRRLTAAEPTAALNDRA
jgi:CysZ protein